MCSGVYAHTHTSANHGGCVKVRGQLKGVSSLLTQCGFLGLNSYHRAWLQSLVPVEPSHQLLNVFCLLLETKALKYFEPCFAYFIFTDLQTEKRLQVSKHYVSHHWPLPADTMLHLGWLLNQQCSVISTLPFRFPL